MALACNGIIFTPVVSNMILQFEIIQNEKSKVTLLSCIWLFCKRLLLGCQFLKNKDASTRASRREINHKMFWQITMAQNGRGFPFIF